MTYKYFSEKLLDNPIDFTQVFPDRQSNAMSSLNVAFGLTEILQYLKDSTDGFKYHDTRLIEIDNAVRDLIKRYYVSTGQENPYEKGQYLVANEDRIPREAAIVDVSVPSFKGKGIPNVPPPSPPEEEEKIVEPAPTIIEPVAAEISEEEKINKLKKSIERAEMTYEDFDQEEREVIKKEYQKKLQRVEDFVSDLSENNEEIDDYLLQSIQLYKDFLKNK